MRRLSSALAAATLVGLGLGPLAGVAAAATYTSVDLASSIQADTSSTGAHLHLQVSAHDGSNGDGDSSTVTVSKGTVLGERHIWQFQLNQSAFSYNATTGKGSFDTGNQISPYGSISLTFTKSSQSTHQCAVSGSVIDVKGSLQGTVAFNTRAKAWGTVGSKSFTFSTPNLVVLNKSCVTGEGSTKLACQKRIDWYMPSMTGAGGSFGGATITRAGKTSTILTAESAKQLSSPAGAYRIDLMQAKAPNPTPHKSTLSIPSGAHASGSAKMTGGSASSHASKCTHGGKTLTSHTTTYVGGTFTSSPLVFNFAASPDLKAPKSTDAAYWSKTNFS